MDDLKQMVLTANRLSDGDVVYWREGSWVEAFAEAERLSETAAKAALAEAAAFVAANTVVNPYLFDLRPDGRPVKEREIIRALGPTVRDDLGKQADGPPPDPALLRVAGSTSPQGGGERDDDVSI